MHMLQYFRELLASQDEIASLSHQLYAHPELGSEASLTSEVVA
jgi:hypothetical protein